MHGLWEIPMVEFEPGKFFDPDAAVELFQEQCMLKISELEEIGCVRHAITYRRISLHICCARLRGASPTRQSSGRNRQWITSEEVSRLGFSSLSLKAIRHWTERKRLPQRRENTVN
jgi:hypothetical protein